MARFWLGDNMLDRYVLRAARAQNGADVSAIRAMVTRILREPVGDTPAPISAHQIAPDKNDVWSSLQRLVAEKRVVKFISHTHGTIQYRGTR